MEALVAVLTLLAGLLLGWLARGRGLTTLQAERNDLRDKFGRVIVDLNLALGEAKQFDAVRSELARVRSAESRLAAEAAALTARIAEREKAHEAQLIQLREAREALSGQFSELATKALEGAQANFLRRADERFHQAGEKSEAQLKALLSPVETTLKRYEEGLARVEKERVDHYAGLRAVVEQVRVGQTQVRDEAARLVNALRSSPKARGRWGEQTLRNVLEQAGLSVHADFQTEVSVDTDEGRLRPDVIVRLPGGRQLIIDAKCSLNSYLDACDEVDDIARTTLLKAHAGALRTHADQLGRKAYWDQFGAAADYVVMFIPGEHFLSAALEQDEALWQWAFERRVLLATPTNLVAIARTIAAVWRQEKMADEARQIGELGKELFDRLAVASGHLRKVGGGLNSAIDNYNKFVGAFDGRVLVSARRFRDLNIEVGAKDIEALPPVEVLAREALAQNDIGHGLDLEQVPDPAE